MTERLHFYFSLSCTGEGNGNPLQCSSLENPRDGGAWWAAVYGVTQSDTTEATQQQQQQQIIIEPDILECEVKWALESITTYKGSGGDGIPVELFQILKYDVLKCCTQYARKFGKLTSGHSTEIGQFSFQSQRKAMPKNAQTTAQLHSSHTLVK